MQIGYGSPSSDLPPAFKEYERVGNMLHAAQALEDQRLNLYAPPAASFTGADEAEALGPKEIAELGNYARTLLIETFNQEMHAGNFEILHAEGILSIFETDSFYTAFCFQSYMPRLLEELYSIVRMDARSEAHFLLTFVNLLSDSQLHAIWEDLKASRSAQTQAQPFLEDSDLCTFLSSFFWTPSSPEEVLNEVSLFVARTAVQNPQRVNIKGIVKFIKILQPQDNEHLKLSAAPVFVKEFNPSFFASQLDTSKVDPRVVEVLLPSWEGNFKELLTAASSLSAECA